MPLILLAVGVMLFVFMGIFYSEDKEETRAYVTDEVSKTEESYDIYIEKKLEEILNATEGVGKVKVAVKITF